MNIGGTWFHMPPLFSVRELNAATREGPKPGGSEASSPLLYSCASSECHHYLQNKETNTNTFGFIVFFFPLSSWFLF
jgi:hypothetical protein